MQRTLKLHLIILKLIGLLSMTIDHTMKVGLISTNPLFYILGRTAFPIFAFVFAENYKPDNQTQKKRIFFFAIISSIPFTLFIQKIENHTLCLNIFFTFLASALLIDLINFLLKKEKPSLYCFAFLPLTPLVDYQFYGVSLITLLFYIKNLNLFLKFVITTGYFTLWYVISLFFEPAFQITSFFTAHLTLLLLFCVPQNHTVRMSNLGYQTIKWSFYIYYPLHLYFLL